MSDARWYAVAFGNGNDGVSRLFPMCYIRTNDPYTLARAMLVAEFREQWREWVLDNVHVDGEPEHGISAVLFEGPNGETEFGSAYLIVEVWPEDPRDPDAENAVDWMPSGGADVNLED